MSSPQPHSDPKQERHIVIIGAGPGGICMGIKLLEAGFRNFEILEKAESVGGTWWHNQYPGAACDVPSHLYSFGFETKRDWTGPFASAPEILAYMEDCVRKHQLEPYLRLRTTVTGMVWDEPTSQWKVKTEQGRVYAADIVVAAQGMFNEPNWPEIPGLDAFKGKMFHSARWDHDHQLGGRRVGMIGTAATAVQCVPEIAPVVGSLAVFQRTPNWVMPKNDRPYDAEQLRYFREAPDAVEERRAKLFLDYEGFFRTSQPKRMAKATELALKNLAQVTDPEIRAKLTPDFPIGCKRLLLSSKFYPAFNRKNVKLITDAIERISERGVVTTEGTEHLLDTLIIATGFKVDRYLSTIDVVGRDGRDLTACWNDGAEAYLGISTAGFPNLFQIYGPNTNKGSILFMIECQTGYIVRQIRRIQAENLAWMDVRPDHLERYNEAIQNDAADITVWAADCNNYYRHPSGRIVTQYPRNMAQYRDDTVNVDPAAYQTSRRRVSGTESRDGR